MDVDVDVAIILKEIDGRSVGDVIIAIKTVGSSVWRWFVIIIKKAMIDNRHDLKYHPKKCYVCLEESPSDCVYTEMAHYAEDTGNMMMMGRLACAKCREEIISVREYVKS